jgi:ABC-type polysaccharide/polyol phosphate transport system ATPase subunit
LNATATHTADDRASRLARAPAAVSVERVSKGFRLPHQRYSTLKERALHPFSARSHDVLQALEDVTVEVRSGEFFGIVGRNGSGKSTLLKCLAGIYGIDAGEIGVRGRLSPFIELGVGFNHDLTARDNVIINAIMLGLSRREARRRFDEIIAFAELEEFVDLKLKNYSSGMSVRLGFSVAIQVDADVLLVDEVLAVGDASFQRKCFDEFDRMKAEGRTILFVTHDMGSVQRFCDRAMLLERGRVVDVGDPDVVATKYGEINFGQTSGDEAAGLAEGAGVRPVASILSAWCEDGAGEHAVSLPQGAPCTACVVAEFHEPVSEPFLALIFRNDVRHTIFVATTEGRGPLGSFERGERATFRFRFDNWLAASRYTLTPRIGVAAPGGIVLADQRDDLASLIVEADRWTGGVADLPLEVEVERE